MNFLCKLYVLSAGRKEVILITRGDISTSVRSTKSGSHSKKADGASYTTLFSPCSPLLHFPTSSHEVWYRHMADPGSLHFSFTSETTDPEHWMRSRLFGRDRM